MSSSSSPILSQICTSCENSYPSTEPVCPHCPTVNQLVNQLSRGRTSPSLRQRFFIGSESDNGVVSGVVSNGNGVVTQQKTKEELAQEHRDFLRKIRDELNRIDQLYPFDEQCPSNSPSRERDQKQPRYSSSKTHRPNYFDQIDESKPGHITRSRSKPITIAMYAEKGGVGKSTNTITLAHMLASRGKRVLVYDCDPQRSITAWSLGHLLGQPPIISPTGQVLQRGTGFEGDVTRFVEALIPDEPNSTLPRTLYDQYQDVIAGREGRPAFARWIRNNLWIVPGHRSTSTLDNSISTHENFVLSRVGVQVNLLTGAAYHLIRATARLYGADYVILDLNPSSGVLNRTLIMSCHYLLVPTISDFFSAEMMRALPSLLVNWSHEIQRVEEATRNSYPFPPHRPKFLGYILSRYIPLSTGSVVNGVAQDTLRINERNWANQVNAYVNTLVSELALRNPPLALNSDDYAAVSREPLIAKIKQFYGLGDLSDYFHVPIPFLRQQHYVYIREVTNADGTVAIDLEPMNTIMVEKYLERVYRWYEIFSNFVYNIERLIARDGHIVP